jgi:hypothetical protein
VTSRLPIHAVLGCQTFRRAESVPKGDMILVNVLMLPEYKFTVLIRNVCQNFFTLGEIFLMDDCDFFAKKVVGGYDFLFVVHLLLG